MKFIFNILVLLLSFLYAGEENFYKNYQTLATPLYSPWLKDLTFRKINSRYPEGFIELSYVRYVQYVLTKNVLSGVYYGDIIECGVCTGKSLDIIASAVDLYDTQYRTIYGIDSFEGVSKPDQNDIEVGKKRPFFEKGSIFGGSIETVEKNLSHHTCNIQLIKGWIPEPFSRLENCTFCFAHIDVDLYQPTKDSLEFIYPRMLKGGIILFDDYGFTMCPGAKKAVDDFLKDKIETLIVSPSGQAFLIKKG